MIVFGNYTTFLLLKTPLWSYVIRNLNLHFGLFPSRHTTLSSYVWNYHLKQYFSELNSHRYISLCPINLLDRRSFITYIPPFLIYLTSTHYVSEVRGQELCVWIFTVLVLFFILPPPLPRGTGFYLMIGHALTCFADNQLSRRSISFSLLKSIHQRLM